MAPRPTGEQASKRSVKTKGPPNPGAWMSHRSNPSAFDPECAPATCLSALPHDRGAIRDHLRHYFGCIEIADRVKYLERSNPIWKHEYAQELRHLESLPEYSGLNERAKNEAENRVQKKIQSVAVALEAQYRRTYVLRQALLNAPDPDQPHQPDQPDQPDQKSKTCGHLVQRIEESRTAWRDSEIYHNGIIEVRRWKDNHQRPSSPSPSPTPSPPPPPPPPAQHHHDEHQPPAAQIQNGALIAPDPRHADMAEERKKIREIVKKLQKGKEPPLDTELADYDLGRDVNGYLIQYTLNKETASTQAPPQSTTTTAPAAAGPAFGEMTDSPTRTNFPVSFSDAGPASHVNTLSASPSIQVSHLEPVDEELTDSRFKGRFPDQRINLSLLLGLNDVTRAATAQKNADESQGVANTETSHDKDNVLSRKNCKDKDPTRLRYFHIPANNMDWVEKAIARYYDEKQPDLSNNISDPLVKSHTQMLLRPQFWRGQQHGARSGVVHARHMRPLCERISSETVEIEHNPKNIVLFMPYLHWDTDRMRNMISNVIDAESEKQRKMHEESNAKKRKDRKDERKNLRKPGKQIKHPKEDLIESLRSWPSKNGRIGGGAGANNVDELMDRLKPVGRNGHDIKIDGNGRLEIKNKLGQYLIDAARLYEAMSTYRDQRMVERYLYEDPPLHPRRTLDQSYYWTLRTTKARDRDQVVYRGTNMNLDLCHRLEATMIKEDTEPKKTTRFGPFRVTSKTTTPADAPADVQQWQWSGHSETTDENGCEHCRSDIRKISQVIMVDQLWMWVLDEKTIITSFPRRYGFNKQDLSGVHKSIRMRLKSARKNQIRSIYDLALIVLDECSNTFFDRTKTQASQPQVMDIFSEAIGNVTNQHTISFQHVWHWTQKASAVYRSKSKFVDSSDLHVPLLDIHPEGKLQREVKDIIDELDIMISVHKKQREVIRRFCKHVERILDPEGRWPDGAADHESEHQQTRPHLRAPANTHSNTLSGSNLTAWYEENIKKKERKERREQLCWFRMQSHELLAEVDDRLDELEGLKKGAESTAQSVNDLLSLKQQQASVVQAWESVKQAEEAVRQGRSIMMFTVITIIFLPMSFISSIFGMNNREFGGPENPWSVKEQLYYILPISFFVILLSVIIAFSTLLRALLWSFFALVKTWLLVNLKIYSLWLDQKEKLCSTSVLRWTEEKVQRMKEEIEIAKRKKRQDKRKKSEEKEKGKQPNGDAKKQDGDGGGGGDSKGGKRFWRRKNKKRGAGEGSGPRVISSGGTAASSSNGAPVGPAVLPDDIRQPPHQRGRDANRRRNSGGSRRQDSRKISLNGNSSTETQQPAGSAEDDPNASGSTCVGPRGSHNSVVGNGNANGGVMGTDENV